MIKVVQTLTNSAVHKPIDIHAQSKRSGIITSSANNKIELRSSSLQSVNNTSAISLNFESYLPFAAKELEISPDVKDYVLWPVIIMVSDLPNRNGVSFPLSELVKWNTERGAQAYKTWVNQALCLEHANDVVGKKDPAYGLVLDSYLTPLKGYCGDKLYKLVVMMAFDRTKNADLATRVLNGQLNTVSMGAWTNEYSCGYCYKPMGQCNHLNPRASHDFYSLKGEDGNDHLVFRRVHGIAGIEVSIVAEPAYSQAVFSGDWFQNY